MQYTLAVFRARSETLTFATILRSYNIKTQVVNTPRNINVSCGISVKFPFIFQDKAKEILARRKFETFVGFFNTAY